MDDAKTKAYASQDRAYDNDVAAAVKRLKFRGCSDAEISYETPNGNDVNVSAPDDESCHVFRSNGGQINYQGSD